MKDLGGRKDPGTSPNLLQKEKGDEGFLNSFGG